MLGTGDYDLHFTRTAGAFRDSVLLAVPVGGGQTTDIKTVTLEAE
jgi:hypothetical protein